MIKHNGSGGVLFLGLLSVSMATGNSIPGWLKRWDAACEYVMMVIMIVIVMIST